MLAKSSIVVLTSLLAYNPWPSPITLIHKSHSDISGETLEYISTVLCIFKHKKCLSCQTMFKVKVNENRPAPKQALIQFDVSCQIDFVPIILEWMNWSIKLMHVGNEVGFEEGKLMGHLYQRRQTSSRGSSTGDSAAAEGWQTHLQISLKQTFKAFILHIAVQSVWNLIWSHCLLHTRNISTD